MLTTASRTRRLILGVTFCLSALVVSAGPASASAVVTPFYFTNPESFADAPPECMTEVKTGVTNAVDTVSGLVIENQSGVTVSGSETFVYRTDFPDGSYLTGSSAGHFTFTAHGTITTFTQSGVEPRTVYAADGTPIGTVMIHAVTHVTADAETGAVIGSVDRFFFTCM